MFSFQHQLVSLSLQEATYCSLNENDSIFPSDDPRSVLTGSVIVYRRTRACTYTHARTHTRAHARACAHTYIYYNLQQCRESSNRQSVHSSLHIHDPGTLYNYAIQIIMIQIEPYCYIHKLSTMCPKIIGNSTSKHHVHLQKSTYRGLDTGCSQFTDLLYAEASMFPQDVNTCLATILHSNVNSSVSTGEKNSVSTGHVKVKYLLTSVSTVSCSRTMTFSENH